LLWLKRWLTAVVLDCLSQEGAQPCIAAAAV